MFDEFHLLGDRKCGPAIDRLLIVLRMTGGSKIVSSLLRLQPANTMLLNSSKHFTSVDISGDLEKKLGLLGLHATTKRFKMGVNAHVTSISI